MIDSVNNPDQMNTLTECLQRLNSLGFRVQFKAVEKGLKSLTTEQIYTPKQVHIVNFYRFEGESNPSDSAILYAISTSSGERGSLIDAYGSESDPLVADFIKQVEDIHKQVHASGNQI
ncbi:MAG: hypothetical protein ACTHJT_16575 [Cytophaga sp.]|uniref:hypothetical protein n=1 Tax=Cytophaga sp. TaxID=29535 RepID=UPI003F7F27C2